MFRLKCNIFPRELVPNYVQTLAKWFNLYHLKLACDMHVINKGEYKSKSFINQLVSSSVDISKSCRDLSLLGVSV